MPPASPPKIRHCLASHPAVRIAVLALVCFLLIHASGLALASPLPDPTPLSALMLRLLGAGLLLQALLVLLQRWSSQPWQLRAAWLLGLSAGASLLLGFVHHAAYPPPTTLTLESGPPESAALFTHHRLGTAPVAEHLAYTLRVQNHDVWPLQLQITDSLGKTTLATPPAQLIALPDATLVRLRAVLPHAGRPRIQRSPTDADPRLDLRLGDELPSPRGAARIIALKWQSAQIALLDEHGLRWHPAPESQHEAPPFTFSSAHLFHFERTQVQSAPWLWASLLLSVLSGIFGIFGRRMPAAAKARP